HFWGQLVMLKLNL
ncbi:Multiphosphoryl transfer protein, partial [Haemophilus influenzae]